MWALSPCSCGLGLRRALVEVEREEKEREERQQQRTVKPKETKKRPLEGNPKPRMAVPTVAGLSYDDPELLEKVGTVCRGAERKVIMNAVRSSCKKRGLRLFRRQAWSPKLLSENPPEHSTDGGMGRRLTSHTCCGCVCSSPSSIYGYHICSPRPSVRRSIGCYSPCRVTSLRKIKRKGRFLNLFLMQWYQGGRRVFVWGSSHPG